MELLIVDANSLGTRAFSVSQFYFARQKAWGKYAPKTGNDFILFNMLNRLKGYSHVIFCFDGSDYDRKKIFPQYKGNREQDRDRQKYLECFERALFENNFSTYRFQGAEADDIIATLTNYNKTGHNTILSSDGDLFQLVDDNTSYLRVEGSFYQRVLYDEHKVEQKLGVTPDQVVDVKALQGDSSDNLKGVKGIGAKRATALIQQYRTLDNLYGNLDSLTPFLRNTLTEHRESAYLTQELGTLVRNLNLDFEATPFTPSFTRVKDTFHYFWGEYAHKRLEELNAL